MVERTVIDRREERSRRFTAADFRVPRAYLSLLIGPDAAADVLAESPDGPDVLPSTQFLNACLDHMRRSGNEGLGGTPLRVAPGTFGMMIAAAAQGDTFGEALQRFAAAASVLRPDLTVRFRRSRRGPALTFGYVGARDPGRDLALEIFALTAHCGFRWLTGRRLSAAFLQVASPQAPVGPTLLRPVICATAVRKGRDVVVGYAPRDAVAPLRQVKYQHWAAHELGEFTALMEEAAQDLAAAAADPVTPDIVGRVSAAIGPAGWDETEVARRLGMSTATLRRRLAEAGASFRAISSDLRRQAAQSRLVTGDPLDEIAAQLGFSDVRSLRRACHGWFGMGPAAYRRQA